MGWEIIEYSNRSPDPDLSTRPRVGLGTFILIMKGYKTCINEINKRALDWYLVRFNEGGKGEIKTISLSSVSDDLLQTNAIAILVLLKLAPKKNCGCSLSTKGKASMWNGRT